MPKYNDFKVGDVWVRRDGNECTIAVVNTDTSETSYPIATTYKDSKGLCSWYRSDGTICIDEPQYDLIRKKTDSNIYLSIAAKIAASQARIEGMKAKNAVFLKIGEPEEYGYADFFAEAQLLEQLADEVGR